MNLFFSLSNNSFVFLSLSFSTELKTWVALKIFSCLDAVKYTEKVICDTCVGHISGKQTHEI